MPLSPQQRAQRASLGGSTSWANTVDRTARTAPARSAGPSGDDYWIAQKRTDPLFADATEKQIIDAAMAAKKAHFKRLAFKSAKARTRRPSTERAAELGGDAA